MHAEVRVGVGHMKFLKAQGLKLSPSTLGNQRLIMHQLARPALPAELLNQEIGTAGFEPATP